MGRNPVINQLQRRQDALGIQGERLKMRADKIRRQQLVLQNELQSAGISGAEGEYLEQRVQTLSNEEDGISLEIARVQRELGDVRRRISETQETQLRTDQARQTRLGTRASRRLTGLDTVAVAQQTRRLQEAAGLYERRRREREETYTRLAGQAKKAFFLIVIFTFWLAAVADILSILDLGWVVSWALPVATWFIVRRINRMNRSVELIATAQQQVVADVQVMSQRLGVRVETEALRIRAVARSYVTTFVRDELISQGLELIPIIDWLPLYLGEVVKVLIDQQRAYRKAQSALTPYRQALDLLDRLERFELASATAQLQEFDNYPALGVLPNALGS